MTVAELIGELRKQPQDAKVFVMTGDDCDVPDAPEVVLIGTSTYREAGVYL